MFIDALLNRFIGMREYTREKSALKDQLIELISQAQESIKIVSGELPPAFYTDLKVLNVLSKVSERQKDSVELICSDKGNEESIAALRSIAANVYKLDYRRRSHFAVVDGKHLALEQAHDEGDSKRTWQFFYNTSVAKEAERKFQLLKASAVKVS